MADALTLALGVRTSVLLCKPSFPGRPAGRCLAPNLGFLRRAPKEIHQSIHGIATITLLCTEAACLDHQYASISDSPTPKDKQTLAQVFRQ